MTASGTSVRPVALLSGLSWPLAVLFSASGTGLDGAQLASVLGVGAVLLVMALAVATMRPLVPARVTAPGLEAFATVKARLRMSDPSAEGHVRSRAPGGVG